MLRYFYLENWKSFSEPTLFSMIATKEQRDGHSLASIRSPRHRVLPIAALYGANASGKSSFVEALHSFKRLVVEDRRDTTKLPVSPCLTKTNDGVTVLEVEIVIADLDKSASTTADEAVYRYTVAATQEKIVSERLIKLRATMEELIFDRGADGHPDFDGTFPDEQTLPYVLTVEDNETLLRRLATRNLTGTEELRKVYNWFAHSLTVITPKHRATYLPSRIKSSDIYRDAMSRELPSADSGIVEIAMRDVALEQVECSRDDLDEIEEELSKEGGWMILRARSGRVFLLRVGDGNLAAEEMVTIHRVSDEEGKGSTLPLTLDKESDGTIRFLNLLPMLHDLDDASRSAVFIVDELDRSIHPELTRQLLENYLRGRTANTRSQLIFTTHDASLMRMGILRRDEIWFVSKSLEDSETNGSSELTRLSDLSHWGIRNSTNLFDAYLAGVLPGSPRRS